MNFTDSYTTGNFSEHFTHDPTSTTDVIDVTSPYNATSSGGGEVTSYFTFGVTASQAVAMLGVGCNVEHTAVWNHLKKPKAYLLGIALQMIVLPLLAWLFTYLLSMDKMESFAVITMGSSPGGNLSNLVVMWVEGVVNLSVAMTFTSTLFSLGAIPFWLYVFSQAQTEIQVPFYKIGTSMISFLVPILLGMLIRSFCKKEISKLIGGITMCMGGIGMFVFALVISYKEEITWDFNLKLLATSMILPVIGYVIGHTSAALPVFNFPSSVARTVGVEVAIQNVGIAAAVLHGSMVGTTDELSGVIAFPTMYMGAEFLHSALIAIAYKTALKMGFCREPAQPLEESEHPYASSSADEETSSGDVAPVGGDEKSPAPAVIGVAPDVADEAGEPRAVYKTATFDNVAFHDEQNP